jgi:ABC-2 type transport system ATP-binding protein
MSFLRGVDHGRSGNNTETAMIPGSASDNAPHGEISRNGPPRPGGGSVLVVRGLRKSFASHLSLGRTEVLKGIDFEVGRGEIYGLLGPNGAGKTTTIKSILGLLKPDAGSVEIFGLPARDPAARRSLGFLPENPYFYDYLTAREFLDFSARLAGLPAERRASGIELLLDRVGLGKVPAIPLRKFSKGMIQRVGLAQALLGDPELVVLDEPMSGLDPVGRREFRDIILSLREAGRTVFFSSHILQDAEMICDRVGMMKSGRMIREGALETMLAHEGGAYEITLEGAPPSPGPGWSVIQVRGGETLLRADGPAELERLVKSAYAAGGRVLSVVPIRRTLEDVFLEEIAAETAGGAAGGTGERA